MNHSVYTCPLTKSEGGLNLLHEADDDAVTWLESTATAVLAKQIINKPLASLAVVADKRRGGRGGGGRHTLGMELSEARTGA